MSFEDVKKGLENQQKPAFPLMNQTDNLKECLAKGYLNIVNAIISKCTNLSKREVKALSIIGTNKYIFRLINGYIINKKQVNGKFEKSLQKALEKTTNAIGNSQKDDGMFNFFNRDRR